MRREPAPPGGPEYAGAEGPLRLTAGEHACADDSLRRAAREHACATSRSAGRPGNTHAPMTPTPGGRGTRMRQDRLRRRLSNVSRRAWSAGPVGRTARRAVSDPRQERSSSPTLTERKRKYFYSILG
ncbi:hypothetical protein VULLAG_LOCUS21190 [Vulpes lagopus]